MNKDFYKTFDQCPACGSKLRFLEELGQELKDRGLARPEWNMRYDARQGVVVDPNKQVLMPIGIHLPGFSIMTDICMDCGAVYAVELRRLEGETRAIQKGTVPVQFDPRSHN